MLTTLIPNMGAILSPYDPTDPYPVPFDHAFVDPEDEQANELLDFIVADDLQAICERIISHKEYEKYFYGLSAAKIKYLWARKKSTNRATCAKPSTTVRYLTDGLDYVVTAYAMNLRNRTTWRDMEAIMFHELLHTGWDSEKGKFTLRKHDRELFVAEFREYGAWDSSLQAIAYEVRQLPIEGMG